MATTAPKQWKSALTKELPLPSGNTGVVRRTSLDVFVRQGKIPNSLLAIVNAGLTGSKPDMEALKNVDAEQVQEMLALFDEITISCLVEPVVHRVPKDDEPRDEDKLYVDEVDMQDKQFIFQFAVGGTADLEKFVKDKPQCWLIFKRASLWATRPSLLLAVDDDYVAYCVDEAVYSFGTQVESALNAMEKGKTEKGKTFEQRKHREFLRLMDMGDKIEYANPVATK